MIIRNCQIITSDGSHIEMSVAESRDNFTGNTIIRRDDPESAPALLDEWLEVQFLSAAHADLRTRTRELLDR